MELAVLTVVLGVVCLGQLAVIVALARANGQRAHETALLAFDQKRKAEAEMERIEEADRVSRRASNQPAINGNSLFQPATPEDLNS